MKKYSDAQYIRGTDELIKWELNVITNSYTAIYTPASEARECGVLGHIIPHLGGMLEIIYDERE